MQWSVINRLHGKNAYVNCLFSIDKSFQNWVIDKYSTPNTEAEPYPLWDAQPVEIAQERRDAFRTPRWEDKSCGGVEDRLIKSVQKVTMNADQH